MAVEKITDHVAQSIARLTEKVKDKTNFRLLLTAIGNQTQDLETALCELLLERFVDTAVGVQLDILGRIVGQPRDGLLDDDYRRFIRARISANNSEGTIPELIQVARAVLGDASLGVRFEPQFPASLVLHIEGASLADSTALILAEFMRDTALGGVRMQVHYLTDAPEDSFTLGSVTTLTANTLVGATTIPVVSTVGFPDAGDLILEETDPSEDTCSYTSKDSTNFYGVTGVLFTHTSGDEVKVGNSTANGYSDTAAPLTGGALSSVIEET